VNQKSADLSLVLERTSSSGLYLLRNGNGLKGIGGLPLDPNKSVTCLISGGIDSPVASFMMQKRGLLFVSFYVFPFFCSFQAQKSFSCIVKILPLWTELLSLTRLNDSLRSWPIFKHVFD
jgi:adenylyl- and sulfurtransferase ThiI